MATFIGTAANETITPGVRLRNRLSLSSWAPFPAPGTTCSSAVAAMTRSTVVVATTC